MDVDEATEGVKAFTLAFQEVLPRFLPGATMDEKAQALGVSPSLLSHWLHGRRLPRPEILSALRQLVRSAQIAGTDCLGEDLARVERLVLMTRCSPCADCASACPCGGGRAGRDRRNSGGGQPAEGDRRNGAAADKPECGIPDFLAALPPAVRTALLWNLGATLPEDECGSLVSELSRNRMNPEIE
ncbi:helix-turn-helix domain-containing protein [Streptomyces chumphonensis]|uniref:helix-turn-helix domain-containing protein n=1 Tax=Streptomyces chumphonensis TaxID=1214925 RepID=UPI003D764915